MDKMETRELISALADGQLRGEEFARGVEVVAADADAMASWHAYHLIGDVLRTGECSVSTQPAVFLSGLQARLADETVPAMTGAAVMAVPPAAMRAEAANDTSFRWKLVAGFASVAAVAAVGWSLVAAPVNPVQPQLAAIPAGAVVANTERGAMIREARLDAFMAAHRELGGASALPTPAGFLRNATFEGSAR
ncbi:sigma-E factor negative regulatory protein [Caenimonas aquaedulcis]|uniref:Sigma-E factor negative regulatory protein n=1 Tax=Caenimonas aquaedulcis TaxID=2793270 RepID=A0A931H3M4_9BURK|nr:sigma-E factor negative regulatory protein [Caenimonas aquaedulcis]MBG9387885.1 sigma-E factor negative regulatory protein [Caenimonas aquaedulcis]